MEVDNIKPERSKLRQQMSEAALRYYHKTYKYKVIRKKLEAKGYDDDYIKQYLRIRHNYVENEIV